MSATTSPPPPACVFCDIMAGRSPATVLREWPDALAIKPRGGVNPGHTLVISRRHVANAIEDPDVTADTVRRAAQYAAEIGANLNLITSVGPDATQTVAHLHWHIVPRAKADGLQLPWTPQHSARTAARTGATS
ncbi:HIT family protein [Streptomyces sp. SPB074]|uniref:HIT family protein n=1 Tax=Streptomyces sp. (strain SPB074) TaxID=465543 RepID=UPI001319CD5E|nr:HIT family protein [Streptomyces sp. SPB074]